MWFIAKLAKFFPDGMAIGGSGLNCSKYSLKGDSLLRISPLDSFLILKSGVVSRFFLWVCRWLKLLLSRLMFIGKEPPVFVISWVSCARLSEWKLTFGFSEMLIHMLCWRFFPWANLVEGNSGIPPVLDFTSIGFRGVEVPAGVGSGFSR